MTPLTSPSREALGPSNTFYPSSLSDVVGLKDPELKVELCPGSALSALSLIDSHCLCFAAQVTSVEALTKTEFVLSLQAQAPACFVWLKSGQIRGRFSDNGFLQTQSSQKVNGHRGRN